MPSDSAPSAKSPRHWCDWRGWGERVFLVILIIFFVAKGFIPAWNYLNSDFPNYYLIARLYREGYPLERVYEWTWLQRQKDHRGIEQPLVSFIPSTLPSALVVTPWCSLPPLQAKRWWLMANLAFLGLIALLLKRMTKLGWTRIALLMFLAVIPLHNSFLFGQMHILVLLLLTVAAWLYFKEWHFLSGLPLALAAAIKIYPALFLIFFGFRKQWRAVTGLAVGLITAATGSVYFFGTAACRLYVREILPRAFRGETIDPYSVAWNSITALLRRLLIAEPELNPAPVAHAPGLYALLHALIHSLIFVVFMWAISSRAEDHSTKKLEWATYLFLLLLLSSQPGSYHFVVLILAAVLIIDYLTARQLTVQASLVVILYALICGPLNRLPHPLRATGWSNLLFFPRLAFMLLLGGVLLWVLTSPSPASLAARLNLRACLFAGSALVALVVAGFISNAQHLKGQFDNYQSRLVTIPDSLMESEPAITSGGVLFTGMESGGYGVRELHSRTLTDIPRRGSNWFHPAAVEQESGGWAEQSSPDGSRIVRFLFDDLAQNPAAMRVEMENAEQPAVSPDGELLAFVREVKGRGGLWVRQLGMGGESMQSRQEHQLAGPDYDVREATFAPDNRVVFSSRSQGRFALYVSGKAGKVEEMGGTNCSARYPAISRDGQWMAYSCEQGGSWQLHAMNLRTKEEWQLTKAECNSISPTWMADSKRLIYATDCGRGLGLTALAEIEVSH